MHAGIAVQLTALLYWYVSAEILESNIWAVNLFMETSALVGLSLVVIPLITASFAIYKYGYQKFDVSALLCLSVR